MKCGLVCMKSCVHDVSFCFLHSSVGIFYVSATDCVQWHTEGGFGGV